MRVGKLFPLLSLEGTKVKDYQFFLFPHFLLTKVKILLLWMLGDVSPLSFFSKAADCLPPIGEEAPSLPFFFSQLGPASLLSASSPPPDLWDLV